jgi:hypothetical protein
MFELVQEEVRHAVLPKGLPLPYFDHVLVDQDLGKVSDVFAVEEGDEEAHLDDLAHPHPSRSH